MNDINRTMDAEPVYAAYKRLVFEMSRLRPNALIVGATLLDRGVDGSKDKARRAAILDFNSKLREGLGDVQAIRLFETMYGTGILGKLGVELVLPEDVNLTPELVR